MFQEIYIRCILIVLRLFLAEISGRDCFWQHGLVAVASSRFWQKLPW
jgi:hypothetical protein